MRLEPLSNDNYDRIFRLCNNVIPWYLSNYRREEVRKLLRCLSADLRPESPDRETSEMMLTDKLSYVVEFGRRVG